MNRIVLWGFKMKKCMFLLILLSINILFSESMTAYSYKKNNLKLTHVSGISYAHPDDLEAKYVGVGFYYANAENDLPEERKWKAGIFKIDEEGNILRSNIWEKYVHLRDVKTIS